MRGAATRRLWRDSRGASAIELAMVLPVLLLIMLGMVDLSRGFAAKLEMEQAAQRTSDLALSIRPRSGDLSYLYSEAMEASKQPRDQIKIETLLECGGDPQASFDGECASGKERARFVSVVIKQPYQTFFDWGALSAVFGSQVLPEVITVTGDSRVRFQ